MVKEWFYRRNSEQFPDEMYPRRKSGMRWMVFAQVWCIHSAHAHKQQKTATGELHIQASLS